MKIAAAQIKAIVGDLETNAKKIIEFCNKAKELGAELVVFPEMSLCGFPLKETISRPGFIDRVNAKLNELASQLPDIQCLVGFVDINPLEEGKPFYNAAAFIQNKELTYITYKSFLPNYDFYDQTRYFEPASSPTVIKCGSKKIAISINEDIFPPETWSSSSSEGRNFFQMIAKKKPDLIVNLSAFPYIKGTDKARLNLIRKQVTQFGIPVVVANLVGGQDDLIFDGSSFCMDAKGEIIAKASSYKEDIIYIDLDYGAGDIHDDQKSDAEMVFSALALGTADYVRKAGLDKALVGMDGSINSAVTLCAATKALGPDNVYALILSNGPEQKQYESLSQNLGIKTYSAKVDSLISGYSSVLTDTLGSSPDTNELRKGIRTTFLSAIAEKLGCTILTSRNKSEYLTYAGSPNAETFLGLSVLSDTPKTMVLEIAKNVINKDKEVIPQSILESVSDDNTTDSVIEAYCNGKSLEDICNTGTDKDKAIKIIEHIERNRSVCKKLFGLRVTSGILPVNQKTA